MSSSLEARRITDQLIPYWSKAKNGSRFPCYEDINPADIPQDVWEDCFIAEVKDLTKDSPLHYKHLGHRLRDILLTDIARTVSSSLRQNLISQFLQITETKRPLADEVEIFNLNNQEIRYRLILLPLGSEEDGVDHVLGGLRHKMF